MSDQTPETPAPDSGRKLGGTPFNCDRCGKPTSRAGLCHPCRTSGLKEEPFESVEVLGQNELRVKVAELCGFEGVEGMTGYHDHLWDDTAINSRERPGKYFGTIPDYPRDLNACHEFEALFSEEDQCRYLRELANVCFPISEGGVWPVDYSGDPNWLLIHATAEQRCRAFVATMEGRSVGEATKE